MNIISEWFGRLGNNLQQISNAIYYCMENKINFYCPEHQYINSFEIKFGEDKNLNSMFYYFNENPLRECNIEQMNWMRPKILQDYVVPNFKVDSNIDIDEKTLIIHIRQGDIFFQSPHPEYVQNPLWYYKKIMKNYKDVLIITQKENSNPVINELKKDKKVRIQSGDVLNDFLTIMNASNVATSGVGTFSIAAVLCSNKIKNFYCTDLYLTNHLNPEMLKTTSVYRTELKNYIEIGNWKKSIEQRELMLNYVGEEL